MEDLARAKAAGWKNSLPRSDRRHHLFYRTSRVGRRAHRALRQTGRQRKRHRLHRLRFAPSPRCQPRLCQALRAGGGRPIGDWRVVAWIRRKDSGSREDSVTVFWSVRPDTMLPQLCASTTKRSEQPCKTKNIQKSTAFAPASSKPVSPPSGKAKRRNPGHCPRPGAWQADLARVVVPRSITSAEQAAASNDAGSLPETTSIRADPGTRV